MMLAATTLLVATLAGAESTGNLLGGGENSGKPFSSETNGNPASPEFVCKWRSLAWEYAKKVQPGHDTRLTFDALMLGNVCNATRPVAMATEVAVTGGPDPECSLFVAVGGDDRNNGTTAATAKQTVAAGIEASRKISGPRTLCIGPGQFFLEAPLDIRSADSDLTIQGSPNATWLSGARKLPALQWAQYKQAPAKKGTLRIMENTDNQAGCTPSDPTPIKNGGCGCYADSSVASCQARCQALGPKGCPSFAWSGGREENKWGNQCCIHADGAWNPQQGTSKDLNHTVGRWAGATPALNVWQAPLPAALELPSAPHLRVDGARSTRARFPDANPETDQWPVGWVPDAKTWLPAKPPKSAPKFVGVVNALLQTRNDGASLEVTKPYSGGIGGPCEVFDPPFSYWCSAKPAGGGGFQFYVPSGMELTNGTFPAGLEPSKWIARGKVRHVSPRRSPRSKLSLLRAFVAGCHRPCLPPFALGILDVRR